MYELKNMTELSKELFVNNYKRKLNELMAMSISISHQIDTPFCDEWDIKCMHKALLDNVIQCQIKYDINDLE